MSFSFLQCCCTVAVWYSCAPNTYSRMIGSRKLSWRIIRQEVCVVPHGPPFRSHFKLRRTLLHTIKYVYDITRLADSHHEKWISGIMFRFASLRVEFSWKCFSINSLSLALWPSSLVTWELRVWLSESFNWRQVLYSRFERRRSQEMKTTSEGDKRERREHVRGLACRNLLFLGYFEN